MKDQELVFIWGESNSMLIINAAVLIHVAAHDVIGTEATTFLLSSEKRLGKAYIVASDIVKAREVGEELLKPEIRDIYFAGCNQTEKQFHQFIQKLHSLNLSKYSNADIHSLFEEYCHLFVRILAYYQASTVAEYLGAAEEKLAAVIANPDDLVSLFHPSILTEVELEEMGVISLALQENVEEKDLLAHAETHPQITYNTYSWEVVARYLRTRIAELKVLSPAELHTRIANIRSKKDVLKKEQEALHQKYELKEEDLQLLDMVQQMGVWRFRLKILWAGGEFSAAALLREIALRAGTSYEDFMWVYRFEDVKDFLLQGKPLSPNQVNQRKNSYTWYLHDGAISFFTGEEEKKLLAELFPRSEEETSELKGMVAQKGTARGTVKIVHVDDLTRVEQDTLNFIDGQILVTTMTQVNIIPIMKRAGAVLTEQGGITSHAAILSRELGIPCIVGVKNLLKNVKDGDIVEVDAIQGTVKKLSHVYRV